MSPRVLPAFVLLMLLSAPAWAVWPHDPITNLHLVPTAAGQNSPVAVPDGAGGFIVIWGDSRNLLDEEVYAQRVDAAGNRVGGWPVDGFLVCAASGDQIPIEAIPDGSGGAIVVWTDGRSGDFDMYVQRITGAGALALGWPATGRQLTHVLDQTKYELSPHLAPDGTGGAFVTWQLYFGGSDNDVYGAHVNASGSAVWSAAIARTGITEDRPTIASDGSGGAYIAYDENSLGNFKIQILHVDGGGSPIWGPYLIGYDTANQLAPQVIADGVGGAIVAWNDYRSGAGDIYGYGMRYDGTSPGWPLNGRPLIAPAGDQFLYSVLSDGSQGAYIYGKDPTSDLVGDPVLLRVTPGGVPSPGWPAAGVPVMARPGIEDGNDIVSDGAGGVFAVTMFGNGADSYASRISASGTLVAGWATQGTAISVAAGNQGYTRVAPDGKGGAFMIWTDTRGGDSQIYAQWVDRFGALGDASPAIAQIKDVGGDQGGHVRLTWNASYLDAEPDEHLSEYWIWRQVPAGAAQVAVQSGSGRWDEGEATSGSGARLFLHPEASAAFAWEYVAGQPASGFSQYSYVAQTTTDSTSVNRYTAFMIQARGSAGGAHWDSAPDSGYSVDNLAPDVPNPFNGVYAGGTTYLSWGAVSAPDLAGYRLYRGTSAGFAPGPGNLITQTAQNTYNDANGPTYYYYKLSALDAHGNQSGYALLTPSTTVDTPQPKLPAFLALEALRPNPIEGMASFRYALPRAELVSLAIYDASGRCTSRLAEGVQEAGEHVVTWDSPAAGLYFVRLEAEGKRIERKFVRLH